MAKKLEDNKEKINKDSTENMENKTNKEVKANAKKNATTDAKTAVKSNSKVSKKTTTVNKKNPENKVNKKNLEPENKSSDTTKKTTKKTSSKSTTKSTTKSTNTAKKSTTSNNSTKNTAKKTTQNSRKQKTEIKKDNKKIEKSEDTKKSKKRDDRIKKIIAEQLENVNKVEEIKEEPNRNLKRKAEIDENKISEQLEQASKISKNTKRTMYKNVFLNILVAIIITLYLVFLNLGYNNIGTTQYITDLKIFSLMFLAVTIILFENAYEKDSGKLAILGIETLCIAIITLISIYVYILYPENFLLVTGICTIIVVVYYAIKSICVHIKDKKKWQQERSDIKEIISEGEE